MNKNWKSLTAYVLGLHLFSTGGSIAYLPYAPDRWVMCQGYV